MTVWVCKVTVGPWHASSAKERVLTASIIRLYMIVLAVFAVVDPGGVPWVPWNPLSHESTADYVASY